MYYSRPESPPPRAPSPPLHAITSLPSPSSRLRKSSSSSLAPSLPPGLHGDRTLLTVRSYEHIPLKLESRQHRQPKRTRSALGHASSSARSTSLPEPLDPSTISRPHHHARHNHTQSLSSRASLPPSSQMHSPPPPVPPIPSFVLTPADKKPSHSTNSSPITPIFLSDLEPVSPISNLPSSAMKSKKGGLGMTCLKFLSLRNSLRTNRV